MVDENDFTHMLIEKDGPVLIATINRPEVYNALNEGLWHDFTLLGQLLEERDDIRVGIITGAGKAFAAGGDIKSISGNMTALSSMKNELISALAALEEVSKPIIAAVNGVALGGGLEIALACDIRIASEKAKFGLPETSLGLIPAGGGTQRLPRTVGVGVAKEVIMAGRQLNAQEAVQYGLAMKVVPPEDLMDEAKKLAKSMAARGPLALAFVKKAINEAFDTDRKTGMYIEQLSYGMLMSTEDKDEGLSAFLEKRKPNFQGK